MQSMRLLAEKTQDEIALARTIIGGNVCIPTYAHEWVSINTVVLGVKLWPYSQREYNAHSDSLSPI